MRPGTIYRLLVWLPCLLIGVLAMIVLGMATVYEWAGAKWKARAR